MAPQSIQEATPLLLLPPSSSHPVHENLKGRPSGSNCPVIAQWPHRAEAAD